MRTANLFFFVGLFFLSSPSINAQPPQYDFGFFKIVECAPNSADTTALETVAYSLFLRGDTTAAGEVLAAKKEITFMRSAYAHALHIIVELEQANLNRIRKELEKIQKETK
ncbi:MAG: hypothetical protein AB1352_05545 [Patescibacteria group bacterium]